MNLKTTIILSALILVGIAMFFFGPALGLWVGLTPKTPDKVGKGTIKTLEEIDPDKITHITVRHSGQTVDLHRSSKTNDWTLPGQWRTRKDRVDELVKAIAELNTRFAPEPLDGSDDSDAGNKHRKRLGLDEPRVTVNARIDGKDYTLKFGKVLKNADGEFGEFVYAELADKGEVIRLDPVVLEILERPATYYRRLRLFPTERKGDKDQEQHLTAEKIEYEDRAKFRLTKSKLDLLKADLRLHAVDNALDKLEDRGFVQESAFLEALAKSIGQQLVAETRDVLLESARTTPFSYTLQKRTWYGVTDDLLKELVKKETNANEKQVAEQVVEDLRSLQDQEFEGSADFETRLEKSLKQKQLDKFKPWLMKYCKKREEWELVHPYSDHLEKGKIDDLLNSLPDIWAEGVIRESEEDLTVEELKELDLSEPAQSLKVWSKIGGKPITLHLGKVSRREAPPPAPPPQQFQPPPPRQEGRVFQHAKLDGNDRIVFSVQTQKLQKNVFVPFTELRNPAPLTFKTDNVKRLEVVQEKQKLRFSRREKGTGWELLVSEREKEGAAWKETAKIDADAAKVDDLLRELSAFKAASKTDILYDNDRKLGATTSLGVWPLGAPVFMLFDGGYDRSEIATRYLLEVEEEYGVEDPEADKKDNEKKVEPRKVKKKETRKYRLNAGKQDTNSPLVFIFDEDGKRIVRLNPTVMKLARGEVRDFRKKRLFDFAQNEIKTFSILRKNETVTFEQENGNWALTAPVKASADAEIIRKLAVDFSNLEIVEYLKPADPDKLYGLEEPAFSVKVAVTRGDKTETHSVLVGKKKADKDEYYAKLEGTADVLVVSKAIVDSLDKDSLSFRPLELKKLDVFAIREIGVQRMKDKEYKLIEKSGIWEIGGPFQAKADFAPTQRIVDILAGLKADKYVAVKATPEDEQKYGLKEPQLRVTVNHEKGSASASGSAGSGSGSGSGSSSGSLAKESFVLLVGGPTEKDPQSRYARLQDDDAVFVLGKDVVSALDVPVLSLLSTRVLELSPDSPTVSFQNTVAGKVFKLEAKDDKWQVAESPVGAFSPDRAALDALLVGLRRLRADSYADYGDAIDWDKYGLKTPGVTAVVGVKKEGSKPQQVSLGNDVPDGKGARYARVNETPGVIIVGPESAGMLKQTYLDFVDRDVFPGLDATKVTKVRLEQGNVVAALEKKDNEWTLAGGEKADGDTVEGLLKQLVELRAKRIAAFPVAELKDITPDSAEPSGVVKLSLGDKEIVLNIGKAVDTTSADRFAIVAGGKTGMVLSADVARILLAQPVYFRDRVVSRVKEEIDRIELEVGQEKATFKRIDGTWKLAAGAVTAEVDHDELAEFAGTFARLKADELVTEKPADLKPFGLEKPRMVWRLFAEDKAVGSVLVGNSGPEKLEGARKLVRSYAKMEPGDVVFILDEKTSLRVQGRFRPRRVLTANIAPDEVLGLKYDFGLSNFSLERKLDGWGFTGQPGEVDAKRVDETIQTLVNLKAERWVAEKPADLSVYGLKEPSLKLELQHVKGKVELHVGNTEPGSRKYYAKLAGSNDVFLISPLDSFRIVRQQVLFMKAPAPR